MRWRIAEERPGQVPFGELQREIPRVPDQPPTRLEESLLEARGETILDGDEQHQPAQEIAEVVGDHPEQQADLVRGNGDRRGASSGGGLALLDPLLRCSALVIEENDGPVRPVSVGDDEATRGNSSPRWCSIWRSRGAVGPSTRPDTRSSDTGPAGVAGPPRVE